MKIIAILSTYKKKNTYNIIKQFEKIIKNYQDLEFEYLFLKDYDIGFCRGCNLCVIKGEEKCPHSEPINIIKTKIDNADGVIFATPVYCDTLSGSMKNLFDHFIFIIHRPCFMNKFAFNISTTEYSGLDDTFKYLKRTTSRFGLYSTGNIGVKNTYYTNYPDYVKKIDKELQEKATQFIDFINRKEVPRLKLYDIIYFRVWQNILSYAKDLKRMSDLDYEYWDKNNLFNKAYYFDIRINPVKNLFAKLISKRIKTMMKKVVNKTKVNE